MTERTATMTALYYVYLNTMIFAILSGIVSLILLLALIYVPSVSKYAILILTVQVGLVATVVQAMVRIWWYWSKSMGVSDSLSTNKTLAVNFCPDYMLASNNDATKGGGTLCTNSYPANSTGKTFPVWTGTPVSGDPVAPNTVDLSTLDGKPVADVCNAIISTAATPALMAAGSTASVPWTELRSRCKSFQS